LSDLSRVIAAGLGVGVLGYVIAGQFVTVAYYPFIWIHLSLIVSIVSISKSSINSQARKWSN
jgi:hypothetical protein